MSSLEAVLATQRQKSSNWRSTVVNILFASAVVTGQVMQNVSLPLWIDSTKNMSVTHTPTVDGYFVLSFASLSFVTVFGCVNALARLLWPSAASTALIDINYLVLLAKVGFFAGTGALFLVFSSSGSRTPPYLQAILGSFSIPVTLLLR